MMKRLIVLVFPYRGAWAYALAAWDHWTPETLQVIDRRVGCDSEQDARARGEAARREWLACEVKATGGAVTWEEG